MRNSIQLTNEDLQLIASRAKKRIEEGMTRDDILSTVQTLSRSQGSYGRLYTFLTSGSEDAETCLQDLEDQCFGDAADMVMYIEG